MTAPSDQFNIEIKSFTDNQLFHHLVWAEEWDSIRKIIRRSPLLLKKAQETQSLDIIAEDVTRTILPAMVRRDDWRDFLYYAVLAYHIGSANQSLAREPIVRALAEQGDVGFLRNLVGLAGDPLQRAWLRVITARDHDGDIWTEIEVEVERNLEKYQLPTHTQQQEKDAELFGEMLAKWQAEPPRQWRSWLEHLSKRQLVEHCFHSLIEHILDLPENHLESFRFWLNEARQREIWFEESIAPWMSKIVPNHSEIPLPQWADYLTYFDIRRGAFFWLGFSAALAVTIKVDPSGAFTAFGNLVRETPPVWNTGILERGAAFWVELEAISLPPMVNQNDLELHLTYHVLCLEYGKAPAETPGFLELLDRLENPVRHTRWLLRWLAQNDNLPNGVYRKRFRAASACIIEFLRCFSPEEAACWLELAVRLNFRNWPVMLEWILAAPEMSLEFFLDMIPHLKNPRLLDHVCEKSETLVAIVVHDPETAFARRREPWFLAVSRLCIRDASIKPYKNGISACYTGEILRFHEDLARNLHRAGLVELAKEIVNQISDLETRLVLRLELGFFDDGLPGLSKLFLELVDISVLVDENQAAQGAANLNHALEPEQAAELAWFYPWGKVKYHLNLCRQRLDIQEKLSPQLTDSTEAVRFMDMSHLHNQPDREAAAMLPAFIHLASRFGVKKGLPEFSFIMSQLFRFQYLDPEYRYRIWRALCAAVQNGFRDWRPGMGRRNVGRLTRWAVSMTWFPLLDRELRMSSPRDWWPRYLVPLVAACDPLPEKSRLSILDAAERCLKRLGLVPELKHENSCCLSYLSEEACLLMAKHLEKGRPPEGRLTELLVLRLCFRNPTIAGALLSGGSDSRTLLCCLRLEGWFGAAGNSRVSPEETETTSHEWLSHAIIQNPPEAFESYWWTHSYYLQAHHPESDRVIRNGILIALEAGQFKAALRLLQLWLSSHLSPGNLSLEQSPCFDEAHALLRQTSNLPTQLS